jgi:purine nucleoside permease
MTTRARRILTGGAAVAAAAGLAFGGASLAGASETRSAKQSAEADAAGHAGKIKVGVLVLTMFDPEHKAWTDREPLPITVDVPGAYAPVRCDTDGLCVAETGQGKANTAATLTAVLDSHRLDFSHSYFMTTGIAGTPPDQGTLGFAAWARYAVDFDLGNHLDPAEAPGVPHGYLPSENYNDAAFPLNQKLVDTAYRVSKSVKLADSSDAAADRARFPGQAGRKPYVAECDTMSGDDYYAGKTPSETAAYIMKLRTHGKGTYCTTQMEDNAAAEVLTRHGMLDRYLSLRTARNYDQPHPGQTVQQHLTTPSGGFQISLDNLYLVGKKVADYLLAHPAN